MDLNANHCDQLTPEGRLRHFLTLDGLDKPLLERLMDRAETYLRPAGQPPVRDDLLKGRTVANLFFEPSTRTRASFELAAKRMSADVLNLDVNMSSRIKGESILDTIYTLQAMQVDVFVVRDASSGIPALIARSVQPHISVLNAGESDAAHPTQGLLDMLTIRRHKGSFAGLVVAIIGDIAHSRVARSAAHGLNTMGIDELRLAAPEGLEPDLANFPGATFTRNIEQALTGADVVMMLRIQRERITDSPEAIEQSEYHRAYGLTPERLTLAKSDAIVMHPGPMNRGVEIASGVADGPQTVITEQVTN